MKKKIIVGLLAAVFVVVSVGSSSASAAPAQTDVTGVVTDNHVAVAGATVTGLCNGNTEVDASTDAHGSYLLVYPVADCPFGSTVKVTAQKGSKSGVATGTIQGVTTKLNLGIVNVSIPEYGLIGAITAGGIGVGALAFARRRHNHGATVA